MKKVVSGAITIDQGTFLRIGGIQHHLNNEDAIRIHEQLGAALADQKELILTKLDELAEITPHWKKKRDCGRTPASIRGAMLSLVNEIHLATNGR